MEDLIDICIEKIFHDITYILTINATNDMLSIEIESKNNGDSWIANYPSSYVEDITQKTGNFKKFQTFVKMLLSAINNSTESVYIDILTYQDLEQIKNKRNKPTGNIAPNNKRYLILSYIVEFDKVHYPLPLQFNEQPNIQSMKNTIIRLRKENEKLTKQLTQYIESKRNESNPLELLNEQNKEMDFLKNILDQKDREILELKNINHQFQNTTINKQEYNELRSKYLQSEGTNQEITKKIIELEECLTALVDENTILKTKDKKNLQRISSLEQELQSTLTKSKGKYNLSRSPSVSKIKKSNVALIGNNVKRQSIEKRTPTRIRKESFDSDTESSFRRKTKQSPSIKQQSPSLRQQSPSLRQQSPSARSNSSKKGQTFKQTNKQFYKKPSTSSLSRNTTQNFEDPEEQRLLKRLRDLREKNKENTIITTPSINKESNDDLLSIDERLGKLTNLLKKAKNQ